MLASYLCFHARMSERIQRTLSLYFRTRIRHARDCFLFASPKRTRSRSRKSSEVRYPSMSVTMRLTRERVGTKTVSSILSNSSRGGISSWDCTTDGSEGTMKCCILESIEMGIMEMANATMWK